MRNFMRAHWHNLQILACVIQQPQTNIYPVRRISSRSMQPIRSGCRTHAYRRTHVKYERWPIYIPNQGDASISHRVPLNWKMRIYVARRPVVATYSRNAMQIKTYCISLHESYQINYSLESSSPLARPRNRLRVKENGKNWIRELGGLDL